jgi:hypothetical protein
VSRKTTTAILRLMPVVFLAGAAILYILHVEGPDSYALRNTLPVLAVVLLASVTVWRGAGSWTRGGWSWPLATLGFAIPALGLSMYLHHGYATDLLGMYSDAIYPRELFRYLPLYTMFAGGIGFAIGWIVGREV